MTVPPRSSRKWLAAGLAAAGFLAGLLAGGEGVARADSPGSFDASYGFDLLQYPPILYGPPLPQADGSALVMLGPSAAVTYENVCHLARLTASGYLDDSLKQAAVLDADMIDYCQQPDGKILVAGNFTQVGGVARNGLARLNPDGSLDTTFNPTVNVAGADVICFAVQPDGRILIGGFFPATQSTPLKIIQRLFPDGSLDGSFQQPVFVREIEVAAIALQPDGKILAAGGFTFPYDSADGWYPSSIMRLNADGSRDPAFSSTVTFAVGDTTRNTGVYTLKLAPDGAILTAGTFDLVDGVSRPSGARLLADGSLDPGFNPIIPRISSSPDQVVTLSALADGSVLLGGYFTQVNGVPAPNLALLYNDGTVNQAFMVSGGTAINALSSEVEATGSVLLGGSYNFGVYPGYYDVARIFTGVTTQPGVVQFSASRTYVKAGATAALTVTRTGGSDNAVSINYGTQDGTALAGTDYTAQTGTLKWAAGDAAPKVIRIPLPAGATDGRSFSVNLAIPSGLVFVGSPAAATVTVGTQPPPTITSGTTANGMVGSAFQYQITATNSPSSFGAGGLPTGLTLNKTTGLISGTPTVSANYIVVLSATNAGGTGNGSLSLAIAPAPPVITSSTTANGQAGVPFTYQIVASHSPDSYSASGLPSGLSIDTTTGVISGTPLFSGTSAVTLMASNAGGTGVASLSLAISPGAPVIFSSTTASGQAGVPFTYQISATNSPTSYAASGLPSGLAINKTTGLISGTPKVSANFIVVLSATNAGGTSTASLSLAIAPAPPVITSSAQASGQAGVPFTYQIVASQSPDSYSASGLPSGLSIDIITGVISGTPLFSGTFTVAVTASNAGGTGAASLSLAISPGAPVILSRITASGQVGVPFTYQIVASNSPTSYAATGLPSGLAISQTTGVISGTPKVSGSSTITLSATNAGGTDTVRLSLAIAVASPVITSPATVSGQQNVPFTYQISATQSPATYAASNLPPGLSINKTTGLISGTPTVSNDFYVTLTATNGGGSGTGAITFWIAPPPPPVIGNATSVFARVETAFSLAIVATNSPITYSATGLPAGLTFDSITGQISGVPTVEGLYDVILSASNAGGTGTQGLQINVATGAPVITVALNVTAQVGIAYTYQIQASFNPSSYTAVALPPGLKLNTSTGVISGTPTLAGVYASALTATNAYGTGQTNLLLTVNPPAAITPVIISALAASAQVGTAFSYQAAAAHSPTVFTATGLPAGLSLSPGTGLISGTPTVAGTFNIVLGAANQSGSDHATLVLTVKMALPEITLAAGPIITAGDGDIGKIIATRSGGDVSQPLEVYYKITGSAKAGVDYAPLKGFLKFRAGKTSKTVKIVPYGNAGGPGQKRVVKLKLQPADEYTVKTITRAKLTILGQ